MFTEVKRETTNGRAILQSNHSRELLPSSGVRLKVGAGLIYSVWYVCCNDI